MDDIDEYLKYIKQSIDVSRTPRPFSDRQHWKAHEWVIWALFYSLPILSKFFPKKYVDHWSLLIDGISILIKTSILKSEIYYAEQCLLKFVQGVEQLYGIEHLSFNIHLLTHLAQSVLNHGPLWTHSAFVYKDFHQQLKAFVKSSNAANLQILESFRSKYAFNKMRKIYYVDLTAGQRTFLAKLFRTKKLPRYHLILIILAWLVKKQ